LERAPRRTVVLVTLTVSGLAERVGLTADTVRYYDRLGLLPKPPRSDAGYRLFDEGTARRLRFIKGAQRVGLRLREISELLRAMDEGECPCPETEALLRQRMAEIDAEMAGLAEVRAELAHLVDEAPSCSQVPGDLWCEREFVERG
jgi:DNA-binding transcriptional MerR regulator